MYTIIRIGRDTKVLIFMNANFNEKKSSLNVQPVIRRYISSILTVFQAKMIACMFNNWSKPTYLDNVTNNIYRSTKECLFCCLLLKAFRKNLAWIFLYNIFASLLMRVQAKSFLRLKILHPSPFLICCYKQDLKIS